MAELVEAAKSGDLSRVRDCVLKRGCDVNFRCPPDGSTALYWSACGGHVLVCDWLVGHGADVHLATAKSGSTALHGATDRGHYECVYLLLKRGGHVNAQTTTNGDTALHLGAYRGHLDVCRLLIEHGADASLVNKQRRTAFDEARTKDHETVCRLLLRHESLRRRKQGGGGELRYGKTFHSEGFKISEFPKSNVAEGSETSNDSDFAKEGFKDPTRPQSNGHRRSAKSDPLDNSKPSPYPLPPLDPYDGELGVGQPSSPTRDGQQLRDLQSRIAGLESYVDGLEATLRQRDRSVERLRAENTGLRVQLEKFGGIPQAAAAAAAVQQELAALRRQAALYAARAEEAGRELGAANRRYKQLQAVVISVSQELKGFGPRDERET